MKQAVLAALAVVVCISAGAAESRSRWEKNPLHENRALAKFPDSESWWQRPYSVHFKSKVDGVEDHYGLSFPKDFDPRKAYPVWMAFLPYHGNMGGAYGPHYAKTFCDANDVIFVGFTARGGTDGGQEWLGDNSKDGAHQGEMIRNDVKELMNEMCYLFNVKYFAFTGASMGGYSSFRMAVDVPREYLGVVVSSCPAIFYVRWLTGQKLVEQKVRAGWLNDKLVFHMHGMDDMTVPVGCSKRLYSAAPDKKLWNYYAVAGRGHGNFFARGGVIGKVSELISDDPDFIWKKVAEWETLNPRIARTILPPMRGWKNPRSTADWYIPKDLVEWTLARGGGKPRRR